MLDPELDAALERRAEAEGVSKAELLRRYAEERLTLLPELHEDPLWRLVGVDDRADDVGDPVDTDDVVYGDGEAG